MAMNAVRMLCGAEKERVVGTHKASGACPRCGGAVVATDVESERRILGLPLCLKNKRKYSCSRTRCSTRGALQCRSGIPQRAMPPRDMPPKATRQQAAADQSLPVPFAAYQIQTCKDSTLLSAVPVADCRYASRPDLKRQDG